MYVWLSTKIAKNLFDIDQSDQSEQAQWTRYFVEVILLNILKTFLVLLVGFLFNVIHLTIICQFVFFCLRRYALGWHAKSNFLCSVQCIVLFVGIPLLMESYMSVFPPILWLLIYLGMFLIFILFAPQKTDNSLDSPLTDKQRKGRLVATLILFTVLSLFIDLIWLRISIFAGTLASAIMILPLFKPIIEGDVFYESYQKFFK